MIMDNSTQPRGSKTIRIPCTEEQYNVFLKKRKYFKNYLAELCESYPELFPKLISEGYYLHGKTTASMKMDGLRLYRIRLIANGEVYTIAPSYIMPYMIGKVEDVEHALFLKKFDVPDWALTHIFGRNDMYWYRATCSFGRNSIVGTSIRSADKVPQHIVVDEKHTKLQGEKVYVPITVGEHCFLGIDLCQNADENDLTEAYGIFSEEAKNVSPNYSPITANTDGWGATNRAMKNLFPCVTIILCFLHAFLKIRKTCQKDKVTLTSIKKRVWEAYSAGTKRIFSQRIRRLKEWAESYSFVSDTTKNKVLLLCANKNKFMLAYDHKSCRRTSNMIDRLMRTLSESLVNRQYFHGEIQSARLWLRARVFLYNFAPLCTRSRKEKVGLHCPSKLLNGFSYSENWLENLMVCSSMAGRRR
jgi:hypothetical protein